MLAALGFTVAAVLFGLFTWSLPEIKGKKTEALTKNYKIGFMFLTLAFLVFGIASAINDESILSMSVMIGDILIVAASLFILSILYSGNKYLKYILGAATIAGAGLLIVRGVAFFPEPFMEDSILVFNSPRFVNFVIASTFLLVWLPVNIRMAKLFTANIDNSGRVIDLYVYMYFAATFAAAIFVLSKKPITLAISFTAVCIAFLMLVIANRLINILGERSHGRK